MMQQDHERFIELIPAYSIGATDEAEQAEVDGHLKTCAECRSLVEEYRGLGEALLFATPLAPASVRLADDMRKRLDPPRTPAGRRSWRGFLRSPAFALGVVALALLVLTNVYWSTRVGNLERQANAIAALSQQPGITLKVSDAAGKAYDGGGANGVVYVQPGSKVALLCVYALPQPGAGKTYQAWLVRDGQRVSAGTFGVNRDGYGLLLINAGQAVSEYQQLGITVEPAGGSASPTTPRVMGGAL